MNLFKSLVAVGAITFVSRVLGFLRDAIFACFFGAGGETDAFFVALKLPNFLRKIFAEGAFTQAFVPILTEYKCKKEEQETRSFLSYIAAILILSLALVTVIGLLAAPWFIRITAPGFIDTPSKFELTITLLRIIFPYILLISLTSLMSAILHTWNYFSAPAFSPSLLNISMISCTLIISPLFYPPIIALAWSVIVGGILQFGYHFLLLTKIQMIVLPRLDCKKTDLSGVWRVLRLMVPSIFGVSISQIALIINTVLASFLVSGSISWIYYADRLMEFPSGVLGISLYTILLPALSRSCSTGNYHEHSKLLDWGLRLCFILALPSSVTLGILAQPLTVTLFQYGKFSSFDALMTQRALVGYSIGLIGFILVKVLASGFYSLQDMKTPVRVSVITIIMTQCINFIFIGSLKHACLSFSLGLGACFNAILLYWELRRKHGFKLQPGWLIFLYRLILAGIAMVAVLFLMMTITPVDWTPWSMSRRFVHLIGIVTAGGITYLTTLWIVGLRPKDFSTSLKTD